MAVTAAKTSATPNRLSYLATQDGAAGVALVLASATLIADAAFGPLRNALSASYANQAAMRAVFVGGNVEITINPRLAAAAGGATEEGSWTSDVDVDAVTATRPEINIGAPATAGTALIVIRHTHSLVR